MPIKILAPLVNVNYNRLYQLALKKAAEFVNGIDVMIININFTPDMETEGVSVFLELKDHFTYRPTPSDPPILVRQIVVQLTRDEVRGVPSIT